MWCSSLTALPCYFNLKGFGKWTVYRYLFDNLCSMCVQKCTMNIFSNEMYMFACYFWMFPVPKMHLISNNSMQTLIHLLHDCFRLSETNLVDTKFFSLLKNVNWRWVCRNNKANDLAVWSLSSNECYLSCINSEASWIGHLGSARDMYYRCNMPWRGGSLTCVSSATAETTSPAVFARLSSIYTRGSRNGN